MKANKKIVFLIGGSGLIGKHIKKKLEISKYKVVNLDIAKHGKHYVNFDCSKTDEIEHNLKLAINKYKTPDILINCSYPIKGRWIKNDFKNLKANEIRDNLDCHLVSYSIISSFIAKQMVSKKIKGKIILFSSIYGFLAQNYKNYIGTKIKENVTYSLIKGGIISLTKQMAAYYGKYNIEINAVSPGAVSGHVKGTKIKQNKKFINAYSQNTPLKRLCRPEEISNLVEFLVSEKSSYITGQNIIIDGGYSII